MGYIITISPEGAVQLLDIELDSPEIKKLTRVRAPRLDDRFEGPIGVSMYLDIEATQLNEFATRIFAPKPDRYKKFVNGTVLLIGDDREYSGMISVPPEVTVEAIEGMLELFSDH